MDEYLGAVSPKGVKIGLTYLSVGNKYCSEDLHSYLWNSDNIFREYFKYAQNEILGPPDTLYYLFSLVVLDQLGAALTFAQEIKARRPQAKVVFGGPFVSRFYKRLVTLSWLSEIVDMIAPGEAYKVLPKILGLQKWRKDHVAPDFSDFAMNKYLSPRLVLPYLVAHGCKWGLCSFCSHHLTYSEYKTSNLRDVAEDISNLMKKHGVEYVSFSDEYIPAEQLNELVNLFEEKKINIKWSSFVRAEPEFSDKRFTKKLYEAGARLLMFGFESASQKVLQLMKKGTNINWYAPILQSCKDANIAVRLDFMVGFPTETEEEAKKTIGFIKDNTELIDTPFSSYSVAIFELREDIPIMKDLEKWGMKVCALLRGDLDELYDFDEANGCSFNRKQYWRQKMIAYSKNELNAELITPQNKTHQLCLKDFYDRGYFELPITKIEELRLGAFYGTLNRGVIIGYKNKKGIIVSNYSAGGIIKLSPELILVAKAIEQGRSLRLLFTYNKWCLSDFIEFARYLYRNDYILIEKREDLARASLPHGNHRSLILH